MDMLYELVDSLIDEEQKSFKKYLTHKSKPIERKDVQVFDMICKMGKYDSQKAVKNLYGSFTKASSSAHRFLRYRIKESLQDYIYQQVRKNDTPLYINKL